MENLLFILLCLFIALFVVVKLTERFGKPMEPSEQRNLSRWAMILLAILLVGSLLRNMFMG
jgi:uncharacterized membrane protein required for colicin V production